MAHDHCMNCISSWCDRQHYTADVCPVVACAAGCYARHHACKKEQHALICPFETIKCINTQYGCTFTFPRCQLSKHLYSCPAYAIHCCFQWIRKTLHSQNQHHTLYVKKPAHLDDQLDLALGFYDQKRGQEKLRKYVGPGGTKACQEVEACTGSFGHTYKYNPAHPIPGTLQWYKGSNRVKQHVVGRPPYHTPIPSFLQNSAAYKPPTPIHWTKPYYLKATKVQHKEKVLIIEAPSPPSTELCLHGTKHHPTEQCLRIESSFSCYNLVAINNMPFLHRSEASLHMSCGQLLRRDQISEHVNTVHNQIMAGVMDGWMVQRCPLSCYGCDFYQIRIQPKGGKHEIRFDNDLGVFYVRSKKEVPSPCNSVPRLPAEIWCLIGQYCDSYTLSTLSTLSTLHHDVASQLLYSRGIASKSWSRGIGPRCWAKHRKVTKDGVKISCNFTACKRWESRTQVHTPLGIEPLNADWNLTTTITSPTQWEFTDVPHISSHLKVCSYYVPCEHSVEHAEVFGRPVIDPKLIVRGF